MNARISILVLVGLLFPATSIADTDINLQLGFAQSQFRDLSKEVGAAISYTPLAPAEPLGILGFDVGIEVTAVDIDEDALFWIDAVGETPPSLLVFPKIHAQKGLPLGFDVGLVYTKVPGTNIGLIGAELKWAFLKGGAASPAVALRGSYTKLLGVDDIDLATYGADLSISKGFAFLTPYVGVGLIRIISEEQSALPALTLEKEKLNLTKGFVGLKVSILILSFVAEADFMEVPLYSLRANVSF